MPDLYRISALAWVERAALELLQLRLHIRVEYHRTQPEPWMLAILDEDLRCAYDDAETARQDLARSISGIVNGKPIRGVRNVEDLFEDEAGVWPNLFDEHFAIRKRIKAEINALEAKSAVLGLTRKENVMQNGFLYTNKPALHAVPK